MKMKSLFAVSVIAISSLVSAGPKEIPEASDLHPDLYTIQFTLAHVSDDFDMTPPAFTNTSYIVNGQSFDPSKMTEEEIREYANELMRKKQSGELPQKTKAQDYIQNQISLIQKSNPKYSNFATIHVEPGTEFSTQDERLKGKFNLESHILENINIKLNDYPPVDLSAIAIDTTSWHSIGVSGRGNKYFILVKLYEPQK